MSGVKGFDLSGLDLPVLQRLAAVLPPLIALRQVLDAQGGMVRVSLVDQHSFNAAPVVFETVAPMQTPPQGAAATDDPVLAGVAAPADAGHPLPAPLSPVAVKPAPAVVSSPAAGDPGPVDRLSAYLGGVARRGPWTLDNDAALMRLVCKGWKVGEIAADMGIDGGAVRDRIKVLTEAGKWRKEAVLDRLQRMVQA
jgi:hypothetical protein